MGPLNRLQPFAVSYGLAHLFLVTGFMVFFSLCDDFPYADFGANVWREWRQKDTSRFP